MARVRCVCGGDGEAELLVLTSVSVLGLVLLVALDLRGYLVVVRVAVRPREPCV